MPDLQAMALFCLGKIDGAVAVVHALAYNLGRAVALLQAIYGPLLAGPLLIRSVDKAG